MGIYDREYYRREGPSFLDSLNTGQVCKWLVIANVLIYIVQLLTAGGLGDGWFTHLFAMKPDRVFSGNLEIWRILSGAFLHDPDNPWHLIWNMLFLWFFGRDMEDLYGSREFLSFYLVAGVVGNLFWGVTTLWAGPVEVFGRVIYPMALGASGAVTAAMVLCAMHYPHRTIYLMFVLPIPLWLFTIIRVGGDLFYFLHGTNLGVAVAAHLGGAGFAFIYYKLEWRLLGAWSSFVSLMRRPTRPRLRVYRGEEERPVAVASRRPDSVDEQLEAKVDAVLEKVARQGMDSLTPEERTLLQRASEQYKKRKT